MTNTIDQTSQTAAVRAQLYADLTARSLAPLWSSLHDLVPSHPRSSMRPALWRYSEVRPLLQRAGDVISTEEAIRRVLVLENPGAPGTAAITPTLYAGLQLLLPGEVAPAHRHTQSAFRLVIEGQGAFTTVCGERLTMHPGDLILTPSWEWHDHGHTGSEPVVWLDGLDIPLLRSLGIGFAESAANKQQAVATPDGHNAATWGIGVRPPLSFRGPMRRVERFIYPFDQWRAALDSLARAATVAGDNSLTLEFSNPVDGGPILPTMSAFCQLVPAGQCTHASRRTDGMVFHVVEGLGSIEVGEFKHAVVARDTFVVPAWHSLRICAQSTLVLFSFSDKAVQDRLGIWRAEA